MPYCLDWISHPQTKHQYTYTLEQQISTLRQDQGPIRSFYNDVESKMTSIINKVIMTNEGNVGLIQSLNQKYRMDAFRVFISGLRKPLCDTLFSCKPTDLSSSLALAQELETNQNRYHFATIYNNGLNRGRPDYFPQMHPRPTILDNPISNNRPSDSCFRQSAVRSPLNSQMRQPFNRTQLLNSQYHPNSQAKFQPSII